MPIYEYACGKCEHEFEVEQRITDDPVKTCPECRSRKVKRLISQTSFVLKGGGWYSDLYSSKKSDAPDKSEKSDTSEKSDKSEKSEKSDAKDSSSKSEPGDKPDKSGPKSKGKKGSKKSGGKAAA